MPHLDGGLVGHIEGVAHVFLLSSLQCVDPWVAATGGCDMLRGDVVAKIPILGMRFAVCALGRQANNGQDTNSKEATAVVTPEILREVAC